MDGRVSTAPTPKSKKWLSKNPPEASGLLRHPSRRSVDLEAPVIVDRPQTCPNPTLTPLFHWNLNNSALKTLSPSQVEQLYGLFKFYDSSLIGDDLSSINCTRLQDILRDARLLSDSFTYSTETKLQTDSVEKIFAQAVMGKMRVYLDADGQPALTFPLFCGALMNCAMTLTPLARPTIALQQLLSMLLESSSVDGSATLSAKGLLRHFPSGGTSSLWTPEHSQIPQAVDAHPDFRDHLAIQNVIADCMRDKDLEDLKLEKLEEHYEIPDRLVASFHPDTLALIVDKFRMFDVNDCGAVPRQELFSLLSCFGARIDLPDPYVVLAKMSTLNVVSTSGDLTLVQLFQVIEVAREAKRHSATSNLAAIKIRVDRAATAVKGSILPKPSLIKTLSSEDDVVENAEKALARKKSGKNGDPAGFRRRNGVVALKPRKSILSSTEANASSNPLLNSKHHNGSKASSRKRTMHRRKSSTMNGKTDNAVTESGDFEDDGDAVSVMESQRSGTTARSNTATSTVTKVAGPALKHGDDPNSDNMTETNQNIASDDYGLSQLQYVPSTITVQVNTPSSASKTKTIRIFLLLGGEHDGAIYCTISLVFASRKIEESEGIYYTTAPSETTRTTPVLPTQHNLTNALLMLKKCVLARLEQGYELRPVGQLNIVDRILQDERDRQPHFSSPTTKTSRDQTVTVKPSSASPDTRHAVRSIASDHASRSSLRPQKCPPHSKANDYRFDLPNNYKDVFATWEISQHENYAWIHDINTASPLKSALPTPKLNRSGLLSPLRIPFR